MPKKITDVKKHKRRVKGKIYIVKAYKRARRPKGKKVKKYKSVGTLQVGHDKFGNIIKSRIVKKKSRSKKTTKPKSKRVSKRKRRTELDRLNEQYIRGDISAEEWAEKVVNT